VHEQDLLLVAQAGLLQKWARAMAALAVTALWCVLIWGRVTDRQMWMCLACVHALWIRERLWRRRRGRRRKLTGLLEPPLYLTFFGPCSQCLTMHHDSRNNRPILGLEVAVQAWEAAAAAVVEGIKAFPDRPA